MKKTILTEDAFNYQPFSGESDFSRQQIAVNEIAAVRENTAEADDRFLDQFLTVVKWTFLYLPGVTAIHFIMFGFALLYIYKDWSNEMLLGTFGFFTVAMFMIMIGIGKLGDLKYLKVIAAVSLTSILAAISYLILAAFMTGDSFGFFARVTLPLTVTAGYLVKKKIDESAAAN